MGGGGVKQNRHIDWVLKSDTKGQSRYRVVQVGKTGACKGVRNTNRIS